MSQMRSRVKELLPSVLLTLLSIVQALALELLWSRVDDLMLRHESGWIAALVWLQILAVFVGIIVIWVVYTSSVLRFRWMPATVDSIYPFLVGVLQFVMVETIGPGYVGAWLLTLAAIFAMMNWISHHTMRRARLDPENDEFFSSLARAELRDFYPAIVIVGGLALMGLGFLLFGERIALTLAATSVVNMLLFWQLRSAHLFWERGLRPTAAGSPEESARPPR